MTGPRSFPRRSCRWRTRRAVHQAGPPAPAHGASEARAPRLSPRPGHGAPRQMPLVPLFRAARRGGHLHRSPRPVLRRTLARAAAGRRRPIRRGDLLREGGHEPAGARARAAGSGGQKTTAQRGKDAFASSRSASGVGSSVNQWSLSQWSGIRLSPWCSPGLQDCLGLIVRSARSRRPRVGSVLASVSVTFMMTAPCSRSRFNTEATVTS